VWSRSTNFESQVPLVILTDWVPVPWTVPPSSRRSGHVVHCLGRAEWEAPQEVTSEDIASLFSPVHSPVESRTAVTCLWDVCCCPVSGTDWTAHAYIGRGFCLFHTDNAGIIPSKRSRPLPTFSLPRAARFVIIQTGTILYVCVCAFVYYIHTRKRDPKVCT
jgi:hypothetical protein